MLQVDGATLHPRVTDFSSGLRKPRIDHFSFIKNAAHYLQGFLASPNPRVTDFLSGQMPRIAYQDSVDLQHNGATLHPRVTDFSSGQRAAH